MKKRIRIGRLVDQAFRAHFEAWAEIPSETAPPEDQFRFNSFELCELLGESSSLQSPTSPSQSDVPFGFTPPFSPQSEIRVPPHHAVPVPSGDDEVRIAIKPGGHAFLSFLLPNPLSPRSAGYWLRLQLSHVEEGIQLRFNEPNWGMGLILYRGKNTWHKLKLSPVKNLLPIDAWIERLVDRFELAMVSQHAKPATEHCVFFRTGSAAVVYPAGHDLGKTRFHIRADAVPPAEGFLRHRLVCELSVPGANSPSSVCAERLGFDDALNVLARPLVTDVSLWFECASTTSPGPWCLDWRRIPTEDDDSGPGRLSLRVLWQAYCRHVGLGLRTLSSQDQLSFLPTDVLHAGEDERPWKLRFRVDRSDDVWTCGLVSIHASAAEAKLVLGSARRVDGAAAQLAVRVEDAGFHRKAVAEVGDDFSERLVGMALTSSRHLGKILVGGVLLQVETLLEGSTVELRWRPDRSLGDAPITTGVDLKFAGTRPRPAGEDPERGAARDGVWLRRDAPLLIDLSTDDYATTIAVVERARPKASHSLQIAVRSGGSAVPIGTDVVVLDPNPMRVARVRAESRTDVGRDHIIAVYVRDPRSPGRWDFATRTGELYLTLPPQTIGEEMIKAKLTVREDGQIKSVPLAGELFDFRLSPPAQLKLDRTDLDTARAPAPWSLRRILDRREAVVGLELLQAEFELLYGLTTRIEADDTGLRIADLDALVGRVPFPNDLLDAYLGPKQTETRREQKYAMRIAGWIQSLFHYPAQTRVFRDWADREQLVLDRGVKFSFRPTRQTSSPFELESPPPDVDPENLPELDRGRLPLRGGVDQGFESKNIYESVLFNDSKVDQIGSPQGSVQGLVFGTLGGSGSQQALFDEGRTLIITATTQGRVDSITIVRVGRIAMLWNHARHVIVYERATRTAPRYKGDQPDGFEGLAALRKVKEYVEITQPSRAYPDGKGSSRRSGPLIGSFFETTVIPVRSSWGSDITEGWIMPLAGPVPAGLERFYPRPNVHLELARAEGKGGKVSQLIETPERLTFYTSTRKGEGSNPDNWNSRADVDFPVTRRATQPSLPSLPAIQGSKVQPSAQSFDYGQARFTVDIAVGDDAVNLMHGRPVEGLEARVRNVSLARGLPPTEPPAKSLEAKLGRHFGTVEAHVGDLVREVALHAKHAAAAGGQRRLRDVPELQRALTDLLKKAKQDVHDLGTKIGAHAEDLGDAWKMWAEVQEELTRASKAAWDKHVSSVLTETLGGAVKDVAERLGNLPGVEQKAEAKSLLNVALDVARTQTRERIERFAFVPERALERLKFAVTSVQSEFIGRLERTHADWKELTRRLEDRFKHESPGALEGEFRSALQATTLELEAKVSNAGRSIKDTLGPLFADLVNPGAADAAEESKGPIRRITRELERVQTELLEQTRPEEVIPPFELGMPDWDELRESLSIHALADDLEDSFKQILEDLIEPFEQALKSWIEEGRKRLEELDKLFQEKKKALEDLVEQGKQKLLDEAGAVLQDLRDKLDGEVKKLRDKLDPAKELETVRNKLLNEEWLKDVVEPIADAKVAFDTEVRAVLNALEALAAKGEESLDELLEQVEVAARQITGGLRNVGERIERAVVGELRDAIEGAEEGALELVRSLAEGPVTDTLNCTRKWVGYYYDAAQDALKLTPSAAIFNDLGGDVLNALATDAPFDRIRDRLLTRLEDYDLNRLLPSFAGLKLEHLFAGVKIPKDPLAEYDWIDMRHGFDKNRLRAWSEIRIDKDFGESLEVFDLSPITLRVRRPNFKARSRLEAGEGQSLSQKTSGALSADWVIDLNGQAVVTMERAALRFDERGDLEFDFHAKNLRLAPALQFVTDAIKSFLSPMDGLTITPVAPGGIRAELSLPLPDIGTGAFTMTGITLFSHFELLVVSGFEVSTGLWLSRPERPFGIAILFLGGGGWFGVDVRYRPPRVFETRVSVGISAGAMIALNFGIARGSAGVLYTVGLDFYRNWTSRGSGNVVISVGMLIWGEFSILGIASAYLRLVMRIEYRNGSMTGYGRVTVRIKICWCFTLEVDKEVRKRFSGSGGNSQQLAAENQPTVRDAVKADLKNSDW